MKIVSFFALALFFFSCVSNKTITVPKINANLLAKRGKLISADFVNTIKASDINAYFPESEELEGDLSRLPHYDIDLYRVVYTSIHKNKLTELSGLIFLPKAQMPLSHLQYHHGTLLPYVRPSRGESSLDAPSLYDGKADQEEYAQYEARLFGNYLASYGYLVSMPDYVGYGESREYEHTYSVNDRLSEQSVDMILATREFTKNKNIALNGKLFLTGWSEGGAASLATQKLIESHYGNAIVVTANAPLAGFYNTSYYARKFLTFFPFIKKDFGESLDVLIWTLYSVNTFSNDSPVASKKIFKYEVNSQLDVLKNRPSSRPSKIFKFNIGKGRRNTIRKFKQNDLIGNWIPQAPVYFHHGTDDDIVYYDKNVEVAVENFKENGSIAHLTKYEEHDHYSLVSLYLLNIVSEFDKH